MDRAVFRARYWSSEGDWDLLDESGRGRSEVVRLGGMTRREVNSWVKDVVNMLVIVVLLW